jgi:hypothetical protein
MSLAKLTILFDRAASVLTLTVGLALAASTALVGV